MIVVKLIGGLGNQMFQYAFGRSLAIQHNTDLFFDTRDLESKNPNHIQRHFSLNNFKIAATVYQSTLNIEGDKKENFLRRIFSSSKDKLKFISEKKLHFDKEIGRVPDNVYLNGYWQSPLYFKDAEDIIRKDFTFINLPSKNAEGLLQKIKSSNAV